MNKNFEMDRWIDADKGTPEAGLLVRYRTKTYTYAGHHDGRGQWIDYKGRLEPSTVTQWREL